MSWFWLPADPPPEAGSYCCLHFVKFIEGSCPACRNDEHADPEPEPDAAPDIDG